MSYLTIAACVADHDMSDRVTACWTQEGGDPAAVTPGVYWAVAGAADIEAAYASAIAADNPAPGADPAVVTDTMILGVVQPLVPGP
jgi:hypothetical protein